MNRPCPYLDDIFHYKRETFDECLQILDEICVIGIINFIKNHIPMCAALVRQLTELTRKDTKFKWDKQKQKEFDKLKAAVANSIRMTYPDSTKPFIYYPDTSQKYACGGLLCQKQDSVEVVVGCNSKKWTPAELVYPVGSSTAGLDPK